MDRILGQPHAIRTLQSALDSGRVHHAWIFHGPRGVGKFTTARAFAAILLDPDARSDADGHLRSDPEGRVAQLVARDAHPDLHIIRKELALFSSNSEVRSRKLTNIPFDVLREFMIGGFVGETHVPSRAFSTARMGRGKVFIIEEAELLDAVGQNALLKTLEEPPPGTYIILLTTQESDLLPTIRSRCQRVAFSPLDPVAMRTWFERAGLAVNADHRAWLERFADGSPGLVTLAVEDGLFEWWSTLSPVLRELDRGSFPSDAGEMLAGFVDAYATAWVKKQKHENPSKDAANKSGAERVFMLLAFHARQGLHAALDHGEPPDHWLRVIDLVRDADRALNANVNLKMVFEALAARWADPADVGAVA